MHFGNRELVLAVSLRNLVSRYEGGRVFPAGVAPGSPSRDAADRPSSRFIRSVETRRRYGWLRMVFPGARASSELQFGDLRDEAARERQEAPSRRAW